MEDLKSKAKAAFDHSPKLKKVFVAANGVVFLLETDARDYANKEKLTDKTITPFTRNEANDQETLEEEAMVVEKIKAAKTIQEVYELARGGTDTREAVVVARDERMAEIDAFTSNQNNA